MSVVSANDLRIIFQQSILVIGTFGSRRPVIRPGDDALAVKNGKFVMHDPGTSGPPAHPAEMIRSKTGQIRRQADVLGVLRIEEQPHGDAARTGAGQGLGQRLRGKFEHRQINGLPARIDQPQQLLLNAVGGKEGLRLRVDRSRHAPERTGQQPPP